MSSPKLLSKPTVEKPASILSLRQVTKSYGPRHVLTGFNLEVGESEFVALLGHSGCGKSTALRLIAGLDTPESGSIEVLGARFNSINLHARMMFQEPRLLPWLTVLENVAIGLPAKNKSLAETVLEHVGLGRRAMDYPGNLSGGQKQRVALARALVCDPRLLLLDEPLGSLDALTRIEMQQLVERVWQESRFAAILVTHDVEEAVVLADRVIVMRDGRAETSLAIDLPRPRRRGDPRVGELAQKLLDQLLIGG